MLIPTFTKSFIIFDLHHLGGWNLHKMSVTKFGSVEKKRRPAACAVFYLFENVWQGGGINLPPNRIRVKNEFQFSVERISFDRMLIWYSLSSLANSLSVPRFVPGACLTNYFVFDETESSMQKLIECLMFKATLIFRFSLAESHNCILP